MQLGYIIHHASGLDRNDVHFLVLRFDQRYPFKPGEGESWIVRFTGGKVYSLYGGLSWFRGLWRSPAGHVYVASADSAVFVNADSGVRAGPWKETTLQGTLRGIWGLNDRFVLAWGVHRGKEVMYRFNGRKWSPLESPGEVYGVHGLAPNMVYAVGLNGLVARWDGKRWSTLSSPTEAVLSDVHVAGRDEIYAVGDRVVLRGSAQGWTVAAKGTSHMFGVAKWKGEVFVGAAENGLLKLVRNKLIPVDPEIKAERIEARGELLVSSPDALAVSSDGKDFKKLRVDLIAKLYKDHKPEWTK